MIKMIHSAKVANLCHSNGIKSGNKSALFQNGTKRRWTIRAKYRLFRSNRSFTFHLFPFFYTFVLHYSKQYYETTDYLLLILNDTDVFIGTAYLPDY